MNKKKIAVIAAAAAAAVIILPRFLIPKEKVTAPSLPVVSVQKPEKGDIELYTGLIGTIEPSDIVYIVPKMAGEVTEVLVRAGDFVTEGQLLMTIDTKQVDGAKINLETASIAMEDAQTNLERMRVLYQSGDISKQQFEQMESNARMAKLQYDAAKMGYDNQIEFSSITAPISGTVETVGAEVHDNVAQGNLICVISGEGSKGVSFYVTERVMENLKQGDRIQVEKNGSTYGGVITEVSSMIDPAAGLFKVKASLEGGEGLSTGTQAKLYVVSERTEDAMTVPTDAVYFEGGEPMVFTVEENKICEVPVEIGIYDADRTEILSGLTGDEDVAVTWSAELFEGSEVEIYQPKKDDAAGTEQPEEKTE